MSDTFTRRDLLALGAGSAATAAVTAVVGRELRAASSGSDPSQADRLAAWTPATPAFVPDDRSTPYAVAAADLRELSRVERALDGRVRAVPHRWLDRVGNLVGVDPTAVDGHLRLAGRGVVQVLDWRHDPSVVAGRLEDAGYERVAQRGGYLVYRQPRRTNSRELRTVPRLDDAVAVDGSRLLTCGAAQLDDPVPALLAAIRAREGGPRLVGREAFEAGLLAAAPRTDLLTVVPELRSWRDGKETGDPGLGGLRAYRRAVTFESDRALVRSTLRYDRGAVPDAAALRALFTGGRSGLAVGASPASDLRVVRAAAAATVTAAAPLTAFAE